MLDNIKDLHATLGVEIAKVFKQVIDVLFHHRRFKRIVKQELCEYLCAYASRRLGEWCDHEILHCLHQVVEIGTDESPVNDCSKAVEHVGLRRGTVKVLLNQVDKGLDLRLSKILVSGISSN